MQDTCLTCASLAIGYEPPGIASGISFSVGRGDYLCIVGENGAGKSTLMKTMLGLIKPVSGSITFGEGFGRQTLGYLPQQTAVQKDFPATVQEIVRSGLLSRIGHRPFFSAEQKRRAANAMERLGVAPLAKRSYRALSGGQQQRVLLARALCATDNLLFLDEPVAGLDPVVTADLYRAIQALNADGLTVIMITHDIPAATQYASHMLYMGATPFFGTTAEFCKTAQGKALFARHTGGAE